MNIKEIKEKTKDLTLLYVEDNEEVLNSKMILFNEMFKYVYDASNGYEGLKKYQDNDIDLIITDINMPVMDGLEMLEKIKRLNPSQKVIVYSAYGELEYMSTMVKLKIDSFITKPINMNKLINTIDKIVSKIEKEELV